MKSWSHTKNCGIIYAYMKWIDGHSYAKGLKEDVIEKVNAITGSAITNMTDVRNVLVIGLEYVRENL